MERAQQNLTIDFDGSVNELSAKETFTDAEDVDTAMGILAAYGSEADKSGDYSKVNQWAKETYYKVHSSAVSLQALDKYSRTPEGAVIKAQGAVSGIADGMTHKTEKKAGKKTKVKNNRGRKIDAETKDITGAVKDEAKKASKSVTDDVEDAAERLASKVENTTKEPISPKVNAINDMVNELFKSAKESPLPEKVAAAKRNPIEFLAQAIESKEQYADVWQKAKDILLAKYASNSEVLDMLNAYFQKGIVPTYSQETLTKSIKQALKDLDMELSEIKELSWADRQKAIKAVTNYLIQQTGATGGDAKTLSRAAAEEITQLIIHSAPTLTVKQKADIKAATQDAMRKHGVIVEDWADETGRLLAESLGKRLEPTTPRNPKQSQK